MTDSVNEIYQQMILEHNKKPRNFRVMADASHKAEGFNPLCGDHFRVYLKLNSDGKIDDMSFEGSGCAISKSSGSMMTNHLIGLSKSDAISAFEVFHNLLLGKSSEEKANLGKLQVFSGIWKYPSRVKCASLAWHAMKNALTGLGTATTE